MQGRGRAPMVQRELPDRERVVVDVLFVLLAVGFFAAMALMVKGLDRR